MSLLDWIKTADYDAALPTISKLPRTLAYGLADLRGRLLTCSLRDSFAWASRNVESVFPHLAAAERRRIVIGHYQAESRNEMEAYWYPKPLDHLQSFVRCTGLDTLREAASSGDGVLLFSSHMGSTGLFFVFAGKSGVSMNIVGRSIEPEDNPLHPAVLRYNRKRVRWIETAIGHPFLMTGRGNYSRLMEKLRAGEVVMMLADVVPTLVNPRHTTEVTFFGRRAWVPQRHRQPLLRHRTPPSPLEDPQKPGDGLPGDRDLRSDALLPSRGRQGGVHAKARGTAGAGYLPVP